MKSTDEKYSNVIKNNTFYYFDEEFETAYEKHIFSVKEAIIHLKNDVQNQGCKKEVFEDFLKRKKELGLKALLAITGLSNESLKRLITVIRIVDEKELNEFTYMKKWIETKKSGYINETDISEWGTEKIIRLVEENEYFRKGLINIFYDGSSIDFFEKTLPPFEYQKLSLENTAVQNRTGFDLSPAL